MKTFDNIARAIEYCRLRLIDTGKEIHTTSWQSTSIKKKPEMAMHEALFVGIKAPMPQNNKEQIELIKPNLPWADVHFDERIGNIPLNPGQSYKLWPFYKRDSEMRTEGEKFSHTYMERYWPKYAGGTDRKDNRIEYGSHLGIRYEYGDLWDVVNLMRKEPDTRQAYLPVWFPEDTGNIMNKRVPCSIGYHFIIRNNYLHVMYTMRSCDFLRHFRDDIYLTVRLADWIVTHLRALSHELGDLKLGYLQMNITSLHIFKQELSIISK